MTPNQLYLEITSYTKSTLYIRKTKKNKNLTNHATCICEQLYILPARNQIISPSIKHVGAEHIQRHSKTPKLKREFQKLNNQKIPRPHFVSRGDIHQKQLFPFIYIVPIPSYSPYSTCHPNGLGPADRCGIKSRILLTFVHSVNPALWQSAALPDPRSFFLLFLHPSFLLLFLFSLLPSYIYIFFFLFRERRKKFSAKNLSLFSFMFWHRVFTRFCKTRG